MKKILLTTIVMVCIYVSLFAQSNKITGVVLSEDRTPLVGANITVVNSNIGTITNANGEFLIISNNSASQKIQVSYLGFETQIIDANANSNNILEVFLKEKSVGLDAVVVSAQKIEEQIKDVPIPMSVINEDLINDYNLKELDKFSDFVPGLNVRIQSTSRPSFVIRGLTSDEVSPNAQPRVSVYYNNVPIDRASGALVEVFDLERVEVLKGPQGTLFGRGAQIGAVHFISKKPTNKFGGNLSVGMGNYAQKQVQGALNIPLNEKFQLRIAGIYDYRDGYIENTFGENLNGKNTMAGRFSIRYLPTTNTKVDLVMNYQKDDAPGTGFTSKMFPNTNGENDIFKYQTSLDKGDSLATEKDIFDLSLNVRHYFNQNTFISSITSYRDITSYSRWDGDGTAAAAIDMSEDNAATQITQELRINYRPWQKLSGFTGVSYWQEEAEQTYWFSPDETYMFHLFFDPSYLIMPDGQPSQVSSLPMLPELGMLGGMPLPTHHEESSINKATNKSYSVFTDATYELTSKLNITAGLRYVYDDSKLSNESLFLAGSPSTLGMLTGNYPNLFFRPLPMRDTSASYSGITGRGIMKYEWNENINVFASYARGRRSNVLQYQSDGTAEEFDAEIVNSFDLGIKSYYDNLSVDATWFYHKYSNFQTNAWVVDPSTGQFGYLVKDAGKATSYGFETSIQYLAHKNIQVFGTYNYIHARYDKKDDDGNEQEYADNSFRLTPDHSLSIGTRLQFPVSNNYEVYIIPSFSYRSKIYFEDANTEGLEQDGYGLLNVNTGINMLNPNINISIFANNILNEEYIISAGNTGSLFGVPTYIAGMPFMMGTKISWRF